MARQESPMRMRVAFRNSLLPFIIRAMPVLYDILYATAVPIAAPILALKSLRTGKYRSGWPARLGFGDDVFVGRPSTAKTLLLHCVSVGELLSTQTLVQKLLDASPDIFVAITTTTDTGTARAAFLYANHPRVCAVRFPLDFSFAVESLFDRIRPDAIALVELETWPNFLAIAESRRIPVALINGRLSEKSYPRYRAVRPLMAAMLRRLDFLGVQTESIAQRFLELGAEKEKIEILPTLKYDNADFTTPIPGQHALAQSIGLSPEHYLFVAGSTAPGEAAFLLDTYLVLRDKHPGLRLAIAPRKPETVPELTQAIRARNLTPLLRTERLDGKSGVGSQSSELLSSDVFVLNTLGELKKLYALASFVFVGRSLVKLGGSDMIEVAALAKPVCFGPFTSNFAEVVSLLLAERTAIQVENTHELIATLSAWLNDPRAAAAMGQHAQEVIQNQRGSTERYVRKLLGLIDRGEASQ